MDLSPSSMDDAGMWTWAAILTALGLAASYVLAVAWQRWKDKRKDQADR